MDLPDPVSFLAEVCRRRGWRFDCLDPHSGYLCEVSDGENAFLSGAGKLCAYPLNQATAATIASDKAHTARLLARRGVRVPDGEHFFTTDRFSAKRGPGRRADDAAAYAERLGYPVFIKPNDGSCGAYADMAYSGDDLRRLFAAMAHAHPVALVQPVLTGREYRVFVVDGEPLMAYERRAGGLAGDGASTIACLLAAHNVALAAQGMTPTPADSPYLRWRLAAQGLTLHSVLALGDVLHVSPRRNVSAGGEVGEFTQTFTPRFRALAQTIADAVGLRVCGFDVVTQRPLDEIDHWTILEVNSNPSLSGVAKAGHDEAVLLAWERIAATWFAEAKASCF